MDTNKLKRFATEARNKIRRGVAKKLLALGFNEEGEPAYFPQQLQGATLYRGQQLPESFYTQWLSLYEAIQHHGVKQVYEEVAYTWFNRLVAIRILQKNGFIDRVLTFDDPTIRVPHIVSEARQGRFPEMDSAERLRLRGIISDPGQTYEQFSLLITAFCHDNAIISTCFGTISDYTSLLLPDDILDAGGFVDMLNNADYISDEDYQTTELLGWLYQFYISERKDDVFASFKKGHKAEADDIAPATQIFTPNWIVKYMVQNTLGRVWLDNNPGDSLEEKMKYLVPKAEGSSDDNIYRYSSLEEIKVIDPACGSGHILLEAFDLLYDMYISEFYSREEAISCIFTQNLIGIDLDTRAKQLSMFALLLKACQKDRLFFDVPVVPRVLDMPEAYDESLYGSLNDFIDYFCGAPEHDTPTTDDIEEIKEAFELMKNADTLGAIMKFNLSDHTRKVIEESLDYWEHETLRRKPIVMYRPAFELMLALTDKYTCVIANPPYMGSGNMNEMLSKYVKDNYAEGKADLFSVFMMVASERLAPNGKYGMINMQNWMFLSSFESLRTSFLTNYNIDSMLHLGPRTFDELSGEVVQNTAFVLCKHEPTSQGGVYYRLVDGKNCADKEQLFLSHKKGNEDGSHIYYPNVLQKNFEKIPGNPIGYWICKGALVAFHALKKLSDYGYSALGLTTADNNRFIRNWHEVGKNSIGFSIASLEEATSSRKKWFPHNKGGGRKWYGNNELVVNWENNGMEMKDWVVNNPNDKKTTHWSRKIVSVDYYFKEAITFPRIGSTNFHARYSPIGSIFDCNGPSFFVYDESLKYYIMAYMNSSVMMSFLSVLCPTLTFQTGDVFKVPFNESGNTKIDDNLVKQNITIAKDDWDSHETSWDFEGSPLLTAKHDIGRDNFCLDMLSDEDRKNVLKTAGHLPTNSTLLNGCVSKYKRKWQLNFIQLHRNEEELNRQFIEIYGLQDELTPDVPLDEITILQQGEKSIENNQIVWHDDVIIKQFVSYAIGCMMGRYSLDKPGLILANQGDDVARYKELVPNSRFAIDDDGIIPLMDDNSPFSDNAVSRLAEFVKVAFGADALTENLNYMEQALGKSLSEYLQKDFWKDHKKMYQSRPIYWLFTSKKGAFRALVYMHRMDAYTVGKVRNQYLLPYIEWLKQRIDELMARQAELSAIERKQLKDFGKSLEECREYDVRLHEVANKQISIDLDDGVVVNYAKYGDVLQKLK